MPIFIVKIPKDVFSSIKSLLQRSIQMNHIGASVEVYWEEDDNWMPGNIIDFHHDKGYHIQYFDGDDEWLEDLDCIKFTDKVRNDDEDYDEYGEQEEENLYPNTLNSEINRFDYTSDDRVSPSPRVDKSNDLENSMGRNSLISNASLESNGILLKGRVFGANYLPFRQGNSGEGIFFRVLYAEGSNQSTMFRCKTPIYKSENSSDVQFPRWSNAKFRFEMVMPEDVDEVNLTNHGGIIISIYKTRVNGGNDVVGQVSIELHDFIRLGTLVKVRPGSQCRILKGSYPLIDRHGGMAGGGAEVEMEVVLEWSQRREDSVASSKLDAKMSSKQSQYAVNRKAVTGLSTASQTGSGLSDSNASVSSSNSRQRPKSAGRLGQSSVQDTGRKSNTQRLLEAENARMQSRLAKLGPTRPLYKAAAGEPQKRSGSGGGGGNNRELTSKSMSELKDIFDKLKGQISVADRDLKTSQTLLNKLKVHVSKHEGVSRRLREVEEKGRKTKGSSAPVTVEGIATPNAPRANAVSAEYVTGVDGVKLAFEDRFQVDSILKLNGIAEKEEEVTDDLLRELVTEHSVLQTTRLALQQRVSDAKAKVLSLQVEEANTRGDVEAFVSKLKKVEADAAANKSFKTSKIDSANQLLLSSQIRFEEYEVCNETTGELTILVNLQKLYNKLIRERANKLEQVRYETDSWNERLNNIHSNEHHVVSNARRTTSLLRNAHIRLSRSEKVGKIRYEVDSVELEILRHKLTMERNMLYN